VTPIDLSTFPGGKVQHEEGGLARGTHLADKVFHDGVSAGIALLPELLEDLLGRIGMTFEHGHDGPLERIEFAGPLGAMPWPVGQLADPFFHRLGIQLKFLGDLGDLQMLLIVEEPNLTEG
jgi:hypothetical protein